MFNSKQSKLFNSEERTIASGFNSFIKAGLRQSAITTSLGNGAVKLKTTGNSFVDQFASATNYKKPRSFDEIAKDMQLLYSQDKELTIKFVLYLRMITRVTVLPNGDKTEATQRGQGLKHESRMRMLWLFVNDENAFWKNINLFISVGSWNDVIQLLSYDLQYNGWNGRVLNWDKFGKLILAGLENPQSSELLKKYLPNIRTTSKCKTLSAQADNLIAKWICSLLFGNKGNESGWTYKKYRKLKSNGTAHEWQQLISQGKHHLVDFDTIHGRALSQLVSGKYLANQGLTDKYTKWIESKPIAKYTGYPYELLAPVKKGYSNQNLTPYQKHTINAQFMGLIETAKNGMSKDDSGLLVVVDSSSSMTSNVPGTKISSYDVAKSMALYFSYLLKGKFEKAWMEFNGKAELKQWIGNTPVDMLQNDRSEAYGSTNFQSVATLFGKLLKQGVPEKDFPSGILCVSDGCFDNSRNNKTETRVLKENLKKSGFSKEYVDNFKIILWDIPNSFYGNKSQTAFEDFADCPNLFHISGLDPSVVAFVTGAKKDGKTVIPRNSEELFESAMNQEVLNLVTI